MRCARGLARMQHSKLDTRRMAPRCLALALVVATASAANLVVDKSYQDSAFNGIGGLSGGGATTRLLVDYVEPQRSQVSARVRAWVCECVRASESLNASLPSSFPHRSSICSSSPTLARACRSSRWRLVRI